MIKGIQTHGLLTVCKPCAQGSSDLPNVMKGLLSL